MDKLIADIRKRGEMMSIKPTIDDAIFCAKVKVGEANCMNCRLFEEDAMTCVEVANININALEAYRKHLTEPAWKQKLLNRFTRSE